jgi:hypothetical protein
MKRQVTCARCGFTAFVDSLRALPDWLILEYQTCRAVCPACIAEAAPAKTAKLTLAKAAS